MAATTLKPTINIKSSFTTIGAGFTKANKSVGSMRNVLLKKTKVKRDAITGRKSLFGKRIENQRRKDEEAVIEASRPNTISKIGNSVLNSGKGLLDRIIDFAGTLLVGWLVNNLPTIMSMAQNLIGRIQRTVNILGNFMRDIGAIFTGSTKVFGAVLTNITTLDFFDSNKRLDKALGELESVFGDMNKQFDDGLKTLTTPLGQMPGESPVPPTGTDYTMPPEQVGRGGGTGGGGKWKPLLDVIYSVESSTDKKNNGYDAQNGAPGGVRPGLSQMTIGEIARSAPGASGRYQQMPQFLLGRAKAAGFTEKTIFSPAVQDTLAIKQIEGRGGNRWLNGKMSTESFMQGLSQEWAALPNAYGQFYYPRQGSSLKPEKIKSVLSQVKQTPTPAVTTTVQDQFNGRPGGSTGASSNSLAKAAESLKGFSTKSGPGGGNIACVWAVNQAFRKAGITPPWGNALRVSNAEAAMIKSGWREVPLNQRQAGDVIIIYDKHPTEPQIHIGIVLDNGKMISNSSSTGTFTWEDYPENVFKTYSQGQGYGKCYRMPGNTRGGGVMSSPMKDASGRLASANISPTSGQEQNLQPTRRGQQVMVVDNRPAPQPQQRQVASGGGAPPPMMDSENVLNNLMRNYLLLDLAYT